ncbi:hypothetical protein Goarm_009726 [Gossypium armourianum]|uniref:Reverse transcriptase zinc-binding domain-containing protein n=1 Tax=Gossypium armourianum TaxID=34283 RepID=A0A7J9JTQ7_9ROSI|nr:hypothetical protein [Gossypium armourianum]
MPNLLMEKGVEDLSFEFDKIWKMKVPPRFQQMRKKCPLCDKELERVDHLFFKCKFVEGFWRRIFNWWEMRWEPVEGFVEFFKLCNNVYLLAGLEMSWRFPPRGWLKFNVCGVVFEAKAGGGGVLRDEDGVARA